MELKSSNLIIKRSSNNNTIYKQIKLSQQAMNPGTIAYFYCDNVSNKTTLIIVILKMASNFYKISCSFWSFMSTIFNGFLPKAA